MESTEKSERSTKPTPSEDPAGVALVTATVPEARPRAANATGVKVTAQAWECSACGKHLGYPEVDECPCGGSVSP